ncbi:alginate lyase family protein [Larkinella terrae]|uniref:Heparinase n=1 Tax=Larkinella terrae TaxID=2025311 RepID=A0A7K0EUU9_9BACT|nr:alginate lyase family protein [Larkinella terrae]MRS65539.1 hypothetical protein [Larkinella terrae]
MKIDNHYSWFYYRMRTMSVPEVLFRVQQYAQKQVDKQRTGWQTSASVASLPKALFPVASVSVPNWCMIQNIFEHRLDFSQPIDWHLDLESRKRFPLTYSKTIDIRTGEFGSAKYVWEVNRLLFLPTLALQYRATRNPDYLHRFVAIVQSWVTENPYLQGVNWYSNIEVNIRLLNWFVCWNILDASALAETDSAFRQFVFSTWLPTVYQHCVYSHANPSYHSSANNHLIAEYAGLFVASSFWKFPESAGWNQYARAGLECEIQQQHSALGVNREESSEYIQFVTDFFLIAYVTALKTEQPFSAAFSRQLQSIFSYIAHLLDQNGNIPQYGDDDNGRVLFLEDRKPFNNFRSLLTSAAVLFEVPLYKQHSQGYDLKNQIFFGAEGRQRFDAIRPIRVNLESRFFAKEGHFILRKKESSGNEIYLHFDAAPLGYLSIAAHGHADALSFIMHLDGHPFFVDSGTYTYHTDSAWRRYFVSTRAHNTVCIDGQNQAFQAGDLLWLEHYQTVVKKAQNTQDVDEVVATHTGYERLGCEHERGIRFLKKQEQIIITDQLTNRQRKNRLVEVLFHLSPAIQIVKVSLNQFHLTHPALKRSVLLTIDPALQVSEVRGQTEPVKLGWYSSRFYHKEPTTTISGRLTLAGKTAINLHHQLCIQS